MKLKKSYIVIISLASIIVLSACSGDTEDRNSENDSDTVIDSGTNDNAETKSDSSMDHTSSGEVPSVLKEAENPTYPIGSEAIIQTDHMEGMEGAVATIVGAYETIAYAVSYTPTNGGERVENHKWVIQEEIAQADNEPLEPGSEVTILADHMKGMDGATAVIDSAEKTTVYMIDYTPTNGGEKVTNHKWVTENELSNK
ncbi:YdhK family protein [Pseudogracilibacillus sp. SE30717A]|uniref:YdhK family protein n=1 Tax=Pseudogracilibacillus sp. SE30717A TaxID=3098293 RepID=UPI00300E5801